VRRASSTRDRRRLALRSCQRPNGGHLQDGVDSDALRNLRGSPAECVLRAARVGRPRHDGSSLGLSIQLGAYAPRVRVQPWTAAELRTAGTVDGQAAGVQLNFRSMGRRPHAPSTMQAVASKTSIEVAARCA
jgi:hypothetical protein